jgi:hypothetical protein
MGATSRLPEEKRVSLPVNTAADHARSAIKAALNTMPVVGGPLSSLLEDYIPSSRAKRTEEFIIGLGERLEELQDQIHEERIKTDEFSYLITRGIENAQHDYQTEKLDAYRNLLVNALVLDDLDPSVTEAYMSMVEDLTPAHIVVLSGAWQVTAGSGDVQGEALREVMDARLPGWDMDRIDFFTRDLDRRGLTMDLAQLWRFQFWGHETKMPPVARVTDIGFHLLRLIAPPGDISFGTES